MKPTVALAMIVAASDKSEAPLLARCLASVSGYVDAIYIQLNAPKGKKIADEVKQVAEQYADVTYEYEWKGNFVDARNHVFAKVPKKYDWIMWLDSDDTVDNPEQVQVAAALMPKDVNGVFILYDYAHDDFGNTTVSHWACRMVRNNSTFAWKSSIDDAEIAVHETLIAKRPVRSASNDDFKVIHHADKKRRESSLVRNIELLQGMYKRQAAKGEIDPRILFYLATHYYDAYQFSQTKELLYQYLQLSGWAEERSDAHYYMGKILAMEGKESGAKQAFLAAIGENPNNLKPHIELVKLEAKNERYNQAAEWVEKAMQIKTGVGKIVHHEDKYELYRLAAQTYVNLGGKKLDDALKYANRALKLHPYDPGAVENRDYVEQLLSHRDDMKAATRLIWKLEKDKAAVLPLLNALPKDLEDSIPVIDARQRHSPSVTWPEKSIAIYVGQNPLGLWGPWSLNEGGVGGSEEAVVKMTEQLAFLGWKVTVFACPGERAGKYTGGVEWKQYWEMNAKDTFDVLISWRAAHFFDYKFKARKKYLWLHDIVPEEEFTKERIKNFDKAIFVSKYHSERPEFKAIPVRKKFVSANGITPSDFELLDKQKLKRDPHRMIYMSANERGLRILYEIWPDVKKAVPDATLDIYYGWHSFDAINRDNPERMAWKALMVDTARKLDGVTERGRIGQADLNKEIFKSGIFAYPCTFPEVNCITAQKAMAGGAIPVTSNFAVLKDIIQYGQLVPMKNFDDQDIERYKKHLISWLLYPEKQARVRKEMMAWARKEFDWKKTATGWNSEMR